MHVFQAFNPFTAVLAVPLLLKLQMKVPNFKSLKFPPELMKGLDTSIKMHSIERRFVIGPSNIQFAGVCVHFLAWGSEGVNELVESGVLPGAACMRQWWSIISDGD